MSDLETFKPMEYPVKILVVDDHPIIYQGLLQLTGGDSKYEIVGNAQTYDEAIPMIGKLKPDLVFVDIGLKSEKNGIELVKEIKDQCESVVSIVLSMHDEELYAERAFKAGARGYVNKSEFTNNIITAIDTVVSGELFFSNIFGEKLFLEKDHKFRNFLKKLTDKEFEIFKMVGMGMKNDQIAEKLGLKEKTVFSHKLRIKNKLNLDSSADLLRVAVKWHTENNV